MNAETDCSGDRTYLARLLNAGYCLVYLSEKRVGIYTYGGWSGIWPQSIVDTLGILPEESP